MLTQANNKITLKERLGPQAKVCHCIDWARKGLHKNGRAYRFWAYNYTTRDNVHNTFRAMSVRGGRIEARALRNRGLGERITKAYSAEP